MPTTNDFKVKLVSAVDQRSSNSQYAGKFVVFDATPQITESGAVDYEATQVLQGPTTFQSYRGTPARTFSVGSIKLISRTPSEARTNIQNLNILRAWRMPYFGQVAADDTVLTDFFNGATSGQLSPLSRLMASTSSLKQRLGSPPEILYFSAYTKSSAAQGGTTSNEFRGNIHRVPVTLAQLTINYPDDVAYIPTANRGAVDALGNVPFPVIMMLSMELIETHSPGEMNKFNLAKYASGILDGF